jgi:type IV pilus assembly protein PilA
MKNKNRKGFTLIELLIVIAIIGVLASVVLVSLNSARQRAKTAAFKSEATGIVPGLISICDQQNVVVGDLGSPSTYTAATAFGTISQACGTSGTGIWSMTVTATNGSTCTSAACTQSGCVFAPAGCQ